MPFLFLRVTLQNSKFILNNDEEGTDNICYCGGGNLFIHFK